ncbi:MAG: 2-oxoacid:ferredoxin oxidoreductase subunit beta [Candidatus Natronoplasma sp.]
MAREYGTENWIDWCPGCGNFGIVSSLYRAFSELELEPEKTVLVSGIGCSGKMPHFVDVNGVHTLHGRAIPFASGIKIANPELEVIVNGGDGDLLGIGAGHFVALGRRNLDMLVMMHNNRVYGLTKGQASPTLPRDTKTKALSTPNIHDEVPPLSLALISGYTFVARSFAMDSDHLKEMIKKGMEHDGAAFLDILQPCVTYNNIHTADFFRERIEKLEEAEKSKYKAYEKIREFREREKIPAGVVYEDVEKSTFSERLKKNLPDYEESYPAAQDVEKDDGPVLDKKSFISRFERFVVE